MQVWSREPQLALGSVTGQHPRAGVDLVVVDVGAVQLAHAAGLVDGGAAVEGAAVVEEHEVAGPEGVAHLELVGAGDLAEASQRGVGAGLILDRHVGEAAHGMERSDGERHARARRGRSGGRSSGGRAGASD